MLYLWLLAGCGSFGCDRLFAPDLLLVRLDAEAWSAGEYTVTLTDAETFSSVSCTATLPDEVFSCTDDISVVQFADGGLDRIEVWDFSPDTVTIEFSIDGEVVYLEDVQPDYEAFEPNGEDCGVQNVAGVDISL